MDGARAELLETIINGKAGRMAFQPIVDLESGTVFGYEALARGEGFLEMPGTLFPCAKMLGRSWELEKTCRERALSAFAEADGPHRKDLLFLNASPSVFSDLRFPPTLSKEVETFSGLPPERVVIELTEQECIQDEALLKCQIQNLSERGFAVALDDFGSGNSGFKTLGECRPSYLKLDRGIVRDIGKSPFRQQLVKSLVLFAETVGTKLILEGVETWEELETLSRLGARYIQGFCLDAPPLIGTNSEGK